MNHIYEYQKGVRSMVLFTLNRKYEEFAIRRLESQNISYIVQPVGSDRLNLYFGREECLNAIRMIVTRPLTCSLLKRTSCSAQCSDTTSAHNASVIVNARTDATNNATVIATTNARTQVKREL